MLDDNCMRHEGPMGDLGGNLSIQNMRQDLDNQLLMGGPTGESSKKGRRNQRREQQFMVRDLITCLALCHNVTPTYPDPADPTVRDFQASSPDEVALVKFADSLGMMLLERDQQKIVIKNTSGVLEEYEVLANFPFSSETKRMGIVLRHL
jgi:phospholipid-translocating ATPase